MYGDEQRFLGWRVEARSSSHSAWKAVSHVYEVHDRAIEFVRLYLKTFPQVETRMVRVIKTKHLT
jgi:hypothetical protein